MSNVPVAYVIDANELFSKYLYTKDRRFQDAMVKLIWNYNDYQKCYYILDLDDKSMSTEVVEQYLGLLQMLRIDSESMVVFLLDGTKREGLYGDDWSNPDRESDGNIHE